MTSHAPGPSSFNFSPHRTPPPGARGCTVVVLAGTFARFAASVTPSPAPCSWLLGAPRTVVWSVVVLATAASVVPDGGARVPDDPLGLDQGVRPRDCVHVEAEVGHAVGD